MKRQISKAVTMLVVLVFVISMIPLSTAQGATTLTYRLTEHPNDQKTYTLTVTIPDTLLEEYQQKNHRLSFLSDYPKFVTPYALQPIADALWEIYQNDEDFTNGVLQIVHQISYEASGPGEYPVETMVNDVGDCDLLSQIAASILQAGGIDVVFLFYERKDDQNRNQNHLQIGVHIPNPPVYSRYNVTSITYNGEKYYIGESTGENWQSGWRIGECPQDLIGAPVEIVNIDESERTGMQTVSASLHGQEESCLSLTLSEPALYQNSPLVIAGQIAPVLANQNITLFAEGSGDQWFEVGSVLTGADGKFVFEWNPQNIGFYRLQAFWSGNSQYCGSSSSQKGVVILPDITYLLIGAITITLSILAGFFLVLNFSRGHKEEKLGFTSTDKPLYQPPGEP
ncbi:MAG: hypothetical protein NWF01_06160 [Candidatus Bathyarchaeota archaeon]|nr:hypothetical protein [Candidatus Bathyarchaeota archaeon]